MKFIGALIGAIIIYLIIGMIAWNLVCSFMINLSSTPIIEIENYRICTYSVVAFTSILLTILIATKDIDIDNILGIFWYVGGIIAVNAAIAIGVNYWDTAWETVVIILAWVYNIVNIILMTIVFYGAIEEANS